MDNLQIPSSGDPAEQAEVRRHAWWPVLDPASQGHVWTCTCGETVFQPELAAVPDELISHPQSFGQLRGER
jgi:hypothetical protein